MSKFTNPLDHVRVAAPCPANWDEMYGTKRVRFCAECQLNVYNLSEMTRREAEELIASAEGRLCVRFYRRADGTILTRNCPVGLRALKRRVSCVSRAVLSAILTFLAGLGFYLTFGQTKPVPLMGAIPVQEKPIKTMGVMTVPKEIPDQELLPIAGQMTLDDAPVIIKMPDNVKKINTKKRRALRY